MQPEQDPDPLRDHPRYRKDKGISNGSFGFVQLCTNQETGERVAIKLLKADQIQHFHYVEAEVLNHRMLQHPHVIKFKEVFTTAEYICIVMEYAPLGNLHNYIQQMGRLKEPTARWFFQQLIIGLDYCHRKNIVNRDIKLENTLLTTDPKSAVVPLLKICDFGYSKATITSAPKSKVGTLAYMAPEVLRAGSNHYDGKLADLWSCGVMLYIMLFGAYPFEPRGCEKMPARQRDAVMHQLIERVEWTLPDVPISAGCRDLLCKLLVGDPQQRLTMQQIQQHPWFLANLPPDALGMNEKYLQHTGFTGVQSEEDIRRVLTPVQSPGPNNSQFMDDENEDYEDIMIENTIDELAANNSTDSPITSRA